MPLTLLYFVKKYTVFDRFKLSYASATNLAMQFDIKIIMFNILYFFYGVLTTTWTAKYILGLSVTFSSLNQVPFVVDTPFLLSDKIKKCM